jgi:outer membrane protein
LADFFDLSIRKEGLCPELKTSIFTTLFHHVKRTGFYLRGFVPMKLSACFLLSVFCLVSFSIHANAAESAPVAEPKPTQIAAPQPEAKSPVPAPVAPLSLGINKPAEPQSLKLGHIDLARVNAESNAGKAGQARLEEKKKKLQAQIEAKRKQIEKLKTSIEAKIATLTPPQREAKAKEFQKKVEDFQKFGQGAENELQTLQQQIIEALYKKVEQACAEYAKSASLTVIVIKRELLYLASGVETVDVTDGVVKLMNESEPKK